MVGERERERESLTSGWKERGTPSLRRKQEDFANTSPLQRSSNLSHIQSEGTDTLSEVESYITYPRRHVILLLYGSITCINSAIWVAYSAIISTAVSTYDVPETTLSYLTVPYLLSAIFLLPLGSYIVDKSGIRTAVLLGGGVTLCGSWIKYMSGAFSSPHVRFWVVMGGQCVAAVGLPVLHPIPPRLACVWYPPHERTVATGVSSVSQVIGIAVGYGLSIALVGGDDNCCGHLNLTLSILVTVPTLLSIFFFTPVPPSPPSPAAMTVRTHFKESITLSLKRNGFVVLLCTLSPGLGILNSMFAFMGVFTSGKGYSVEVSGLIGVIMVSVGLIGAVTFGAIADRTQKVVPLCRISFFLSAITATLFVCSIQFRFPAYVVLLLSGLFGFFLLSLLPLCLEFAVEVTYPAAEGVVTGTIMWIGNICGLASFFFTNALLMEEADGETNPTVSLWFAMFGMVCCGVGGTLLHGDLVRRREERRMEGKGEDVEGG